MRTPIAIVLSAAACSGASPALADPFWLYDRSATAPQTARGFYIGPNIQGGVQMLPRFNSTVTLHTPSAPGAPVSSATKFDPDVKGAIPGGTLGYLFRDGTFPSFFGQRVRLEFSGHAISMTGRESAARTETTGDAIVVSGVGGRNLAVLGGVPSTLHEDVRIRRDGLGFRLAIASQWTLGPNLTGSPAVGAFGGQIIDSYKMNFGELLNVLPVASVGTLSERIRTREFGGDLGATLNWQVWPGVGVQVGGTAGVVYVRSKLNGQDCFTGALAFPLFADCGPAFTTAISTVADSRSAVGFRGTANVALNVDMRFGIMTVGGYFRYDSHVPGVENPQAVVAPVAPGGPNASARLRFAGDFGYGGFFRFVVPLQFGAGY